MGSGAVGVEFASIFRRFGSEVTIIELLPRLVPVEDEAVSAELEKSFRKQGITVHTGAKVTQRGGDGDGVDVDAQLADGTTQTICAPTTCSSRPAAGRSPTGLERRRRSACSSRRGYIKVDDAVPDERAGHLGDRRRHHARRAGPSAARARLVGRRHRRRRADRRAGRRGRSTTTTCPAAPTAIPEIGSVGLTEREAQERGYDVRVGTFPFGVLGRAKMAGETEGFVKIVAEKKYDEVLGVHMIGPRATELVAEATLALRLECTVEELIRTIHAHPTMAEAVGEAAHAAHGAAIHM